MTDGAQCASFLGFLPLDLTLEDGLLILSWLLLFFVWAFTRLRPRLKAFRAPITLLLLSATFARIIVLMNLGNLTIVAAMRRPSRPFVFRVLTDRFRARSFAAFRKADRSEGKSSFSAASFGWLFVFVKMLPRAMKLLPV